MKFLFLEKFPNTKLIIVGRCEEYKNLVSLVESLGSREKVIIRPEWISEDEKIAHFSLVDMPFSFSYGNLLADSLDAFYDQIACDA